MAIVAIGFSFAVGLWKEIANYPNWLMAKFLFHCILMLFTIKGRWRYKWILLNELEKRRNPIDVYQSGNDKYIMYKKNGETSVKRKAVKNGGRHLSKKDSLGIYNEFILKMCFALVIWVRFVGWHFIWKRIKSWSSYSVKVFSIQHSQSVREKYFKSANKRRSLRE